MAASELGIKGCHYISNIGGFMFSYICFFQYLHQVPDASMFVGIHCQTMEKKCEYAAAYSVGQQLAEEMIAKGADSILAKAKATSKEEILAEHARKQEEEKERSRKRKHSGDKQLPHIDPMKRYLMAQHHDMSQMLLPGDAAITLPSTSKHHELPLHLQGNKEAGTSLTETEASSSSSSSSL